MGLSFTKLIKFDLLDNIEASLVGGGMGSDKFMDFFRMAQQIRNVDQFVRDLPSFPRSNKNIIRDEMALAIGSTLAIEGLTLKEDEIKETLKKTDLQQNLQRKEREILNSRNVYNYIKRAVADCEGDFVYQEEHILNIHKFFTAGIEYIGNNPGQYRTTNATFGEPRKISLCGSYADIYTAITNFVHWLNQKPTGILTSDIIAKAIMSHYYFTEIHPFGDGNGRTARAIEAMVLYANKINPYCFWSLANFWSTHRNEYLANLGNIRETCNPIDFLAWGAHGYFEEVTRVKGRVLRKVKQLMLQDYVQYLFKSKQEQAPKNRINTRIVRLLFLLTHSSGMPFDKFKSSAEYEALYSHESNSTKSRDLTKMKSLELIRISEIDGKEFIEPNYDILDNLEYIV